MTWRFHGESGPQIALLLMALAGALCASSAGAADAGLDVNVVLSQTGSASLYGQTVQRGLQIAEIGSAVVVVAPRPSSSANAVGASRL